MMMKWTAAIAAVVMMAAATLMSAQDNRVRFSPRLKDPRRRCGRNRDRCEALGVAWEAINFRKEDFPLSGNGVARLAATV